MEQSDCSASSWRKFFSSAGFETEFAKCYAATFSKNQINLDMLPYITKDYLLDMGITLIGHIIAILRHAKTVYSETETKTTLFSNGKGHPEKPTMKTTPIVILENDPPSVPPSQLPSKRKQGEEMANPAKIVKFSSQQMVQTKKSMHVKSVVNLIEAPEKVKETEGRKNVFARSGIDNLPLSSDESSSREGVFARLGNKTLDEPPPPIITAATPRVVLPKMRISNLQSRAPITGAIKPESLTTHENNERDIHPNIILSRKVSLTKTSSMRTFKQVRFAGVTDKVIPREPKSDLTAEQLRSFSFDESANQQRPMSSGVFNRLDV